MQRHFSQQMPESVSYSRIRLYYNLKQTFLFFSLTVRLLSVGEVSSYAHNLNSSIHFLLDAFPFFLVAFTLVCLTVNDNGNGTKAWREEEISLCTVNPLLTVNSFLLVL